MALRDLGSFFFRPAYYWNFVVPNISKIFPVFFCSPIILQMQFTFPGFYGHPLLSLFLLPFLITPFCSHSLDVFQRNVLGTMKQHCFLWNGSEKTASPAICVHPDGQPDTGWCWHCLLTMMDKTPKRWLVSLGHHMSLGTKLNFGVKATLS